jgi:hypothetical protein
VGQGVNTVEFGVNQRADQNDGLGPTALALDSVAYLSNLQASGELSKLHLVHPGWTGNGFEPLNELIAPLSLASQRKHGFSPVTPCTGLAQG